MSEQIYLCLVTRAIYPGNADEHCARNTGLTQLIFSFHVKSHFPEKLQLETPKHKLLVVNPCGSHPPGNYLVLFHVFYGAMMWRVIYGQITLWAAWGIPRTLVPTSSSLKEYTTFLRRSCLWVSFLWKSKYREESR